MGVVASSTNNDHQQCPLRRQQKVQSQLRLVRSMCAWSSSRAYPLFSVVRLATRSGINSQTQDSMGWSLFRKPTDVAEHCHAASSDARNDALFFGPVQYCGVGDEVVPSYIKDSSLARHVKCLTSPLVCL